jgi:quercetin dioxygenase-like cupin family protein
MKKGGKPGIQSNLLTNPQPQIPIRYRAEEERQEMNRREFAGLAAFAPLVAASDLRDAPADKPYILLPESARVYDIGHGEARVLVGAEQSGGAWWLAGILSEPGRKTSLHVHFSADEHVYVLEGVLSAWVDDRWQDLPVGAVGILPRRIPHALGNRSKQPVRYLGSGNPAGFERFFADIEITSRHFPYGSPEFLAELKRVYKKYDSELLGPPPQG